MSATIVVDLGFGDAGKGSIVDFLARRTEAKATVVRFNGGGQAAHNVITPSGMHHTFAQFGAAALSGGRTFLSRFMLLDPLSLGNEARHLTECGAGNPYDDLFVDENALVVTTMHKLANRERERERGDDRHGSCGMGIGEAVAMSLAHPEMSVRACDLNNSVMLRIKFRQQYHWLCEEFPAIKNRYSPQHVVLEHDHTEVIGRRLNIVDGSVLKQFGNDSDLIFEGAQGVLLDETLGFHPHTTWSDCTVKNADTLLHDADYAMSVMHLGILRSYMVRHGPGPLPTEDQELTERLPERHNHTDEWQGVFRVGWFDAVLARYAAEVCGGIDVLAITNIDRLSGQKPNLATHYDNGGSLSRRLIPVKEPTTVAQAGLGHYVNKCKPVYCTSSSPHEHVDLIGQEMAIPIWLKSFGPTATDKEIVKLRST